MSEESYAKNAMFLWLRYCSRLKVGIILYHIFIFCGYIEKDIILVWMHILTISRLSLSTKVTESRYLW